MRIKRQSLPAPSGTGQRGDCRQTHTHTQDESACAHNHLMLASGELLRPTFWSSYIIRLHRVCKHVKSLSLLSRRVWRVSKSTLTNFYPKCHLLPPPSPPQSSFTIYNGIFHNCTVWEKPLRCFNIASSKL